MVIINPNRMKNLFLLILIFTVQRAFSQQEMKADEQNGLLRIKITDMKGKARENEEVSFMGTQSKKTFSGISNRDGRFTILLPKGDVYKIKITAIGGQTDYSTLSIPAEPGIYSGELVIKFELPSTITLDDVLFKSGSATLESSSHKSLNELADFMKRKQNLEIEVAGHTDNVGSEESNLILSQKRAESVKNFLISKGVAENRMIAKGYGQSQPVEDNTTETGRKKNRRTEIRVLKQ